MSIAAVVLAAGGGSRFLGPAHKLLTVFRGRPIVAWAIARAVEAGMDETCVVTGAVALGEVVPLGVTALQNDRWADGMATSLARAFEHAELAGHGAVVVGLGDQPLVGAPAWRAVAAASSPVVIATYGGRRGHPVKLAREVWSLLPKDGDEGARSLLRDRPDLVREVACDGDPADVDTVEDLDQWS